MVYLVLANVVVILHLAFVVFVLFGGVMAWRWSRVAWLHLPSVFWGVSIEWTGLRCPLTPLENWLRGQSGTAAYEGDFVERYLLPLLYPEELTRTVQLAIGSFVLILNVGVYVWLLRWRCHTN